MTEAENVIELISADSSDPDVELNQDDVRTLSQEINDLEATKEDLVKQLKSRPKKDRKNDKSTIEKEKDVGILLTIGNYRKISGVLKERFSDFHVNEIDLDGNIVRLTSLEFVESQPVISLDNPSLSQWVNEATLASLQELQGANGSEAKSKCVEFAVTSMSKDERTNVHRWLRNFDNLVSETIDKSGEKYIVVKHKTKDKSNFIRRPANRARYTHCVLYKEGIETSDAIGFLAKKLRLSPNFITYAGNKDKRAKTTQRICVSNIDARRLVDLNRCSPHTKLGNFSYSPSKIHLGDLKGNHFKILLKDIHCHPSSDISVEDCIEKGIQSLSTNGFINYYGLQRFGSYDIPTHMIGKTLLQMKWEELFDLILEVKSNDATFVKKAKNAWLQDRDPEKARRLVPDWYRSIESNLIHGLAKYYKFKDYASVMNHIPRNVRLLYIHSFQSYIWNCLVTYRLAEYGQKPVVGDIVYSNSDMNNTWSEGLDITFDDTQTPNDTESESTMTSQKGLPEVKVLREEDLKDYTIFDILIPLDGTGIKYPTNRVRDYSLKLLEESGVPANYLAAFTLRSDTPRGAYRKIVVLPANLTYKIIPYNVNDNLDSLIPSDLDLLRKQNPNETNECRGGTNRVRTESPGLNDEDKLQDKKCLQIEFSLPASSYATMTLRELLSEEVNESATTTNIEDSLEKEAYNNNCDNQELKRKIDTSNENSGNNVEDVEKKLKLASD